MPVLPATDDDSLTPVRTHVLRHRPERVWQILADLRGRGVLLTPPWAIPVRQHPNGEVTVRFDVREPAPAARWHLPRAVSGVLAVAAALACLLLTGFLAQALFAEHLGPALRLLGAGMAVVAVLLLAAARLGGVGRRCPGAHCPCGRH